MLSKGVTVKFEDSKIRDLDAIKKIIVTTFYFKLIPKIEGAVKIPSASVIIKNKAIESKEYILEVKKPEKTLKEKIIDYTTDSWSLEEQNVFLEYCKKGAISNKKMSLNQVNKYCNCCLIDMMIKYSKPTNDIDAKWFYETSIKCEDKTLELFKLLKP